MTCAISEKCALAVDEVLAKNPDEVGALTQWNEVMEILFQHKVAYKIVLHPDFLFVHSENRGGLGLNQPFQCARQHVQNSPHRCSLIDVYLVDMLRDTKKSDTAIGASRLQFGVDQVRIWVTCSTNRPRTVSVGRQRTLRC